jgi:hypothetical protein
MRSISRSESIVPPFPTKMGIGQQDVKSLKEIWTILKIAQNGSNFPLHIGLRRLNAAHERINPEDAILDIIIALEALILNDTTAPQERGEMRFRLSLRVAYLLGCSAQEMKNISGTVKKAYDLRSDVVHGGRGKFSKTELQVYNDIREILRRTARTLLFMSARGEKPQWELWQFD